MISLRPPFLGPLAALVGALGCAAPRTPAWERPPAPDPAPSARSPADVRQLLAQAESAWAERAERDQLLRAIYAWQSAVRIRPDDGATLVRMARAADLYADAFLDPALASDTERPRYEEMHEQGIRYAELALVQLSSSFRGRVQAGASPEDALDLIARDGAGALYFYAQNLAKWSSSKGFGTRRAYREKVLKILRRCLELDPDLFYGGPDRALGAAYAAEGGAELDKARDHFEAALRIAPHFFANHVDYAATYATRIKDRALFRQELELVVGAPEGVLPEVVPEQRLARRRARRLLDQIDARF